MKGNFWLSFGGGLAKTNTSFCSSSASPVIGKISDKEEKHFFICIGYSETCGRHDDIHKLSLQLVMKYFYLFLIVTTFIFHNSVNSNWNNAGALMCVITTPFSYTNNFVWISGIFICNSKCNLVLKSIENWIEGKKHKKKILLLK